MNNMYDYLMTRNYGMRKVAALDPATRKKMTQTLDRLKAIPNKTKKDLDNIYYLNRELKSDYPKINTKPLDIATGVVDFISRFSPTQLIDRYAGQSVINLLNNRDSRREVTQQKLNADRKRALQEKGIRERDRQSAKDLADLLYTGGAGLGGLAAGGAAGYALSKENKLRNAIISGLVTGALAGGGTYALRKYMK